MPRAEARFDALLRPGADRHRTAPADSRPTTLHRQYRTDWVQSLQRAVFSAAATRATRLPWKRATARSSMPGSALFVPDTEDAP